MAKTTIDGLKVRESGSKRKANAAAQASSAHTVDLNTKRPAKSPANVSPSRQKMLSSIDQIRGHKSSASSFLDPVQSFDFDAEPTTQATYDFNTGVETDWSDLLDNFGSSSPKHQLALPASTATDNNPTEDLLNAWDTDEPATSTPLSDSLIDDDTPVSPSPKKSKTKRHKKHHIGRIVAITAACLLVIAGGVLYKWGDALISRLTGGNSGLWDALVSFVSDEVPFEADTNGRTNVLVFGTEGYNMNGDTAYGAHDGAQLTDSIMVISFDQKTKDVALLSLPRDLKVSMACSAGKINEVFWCHNKNGTNETAGAQALMDQVGMILGVNFQYYAHINWASLIDIIDTLGGITVTLDEDINDYGWTNAVAQAGVPITVNGEQALGLARARHGTVGGDFTRGNTQQKIVEGIVSKVLDNGVGVTEALNLLNILGDNLRSNFSTDNVKAGVHLASGFNLANIRQVPLVNYDTNTFYVTTATINDISYVVPSAGANDYSKIQAYVAEMFSSNPAVREQARIVVYNASGQYGAASAERVRLQNDDYDVIDVGDAEIGSCPESYCLYALNENFPATSSALAERYHTTIRSRDELPESITPGEVDFILLLGFNEGQAQVFLNTNILAPDLTIIGG